MTESERLFITDWLDEGVQFFRDKGKGEVGEWWARKIEQVFGSQQFLKALHNDSGLYDD